MRARYHGAAAHEIAWPSDVVAIGLLFSSYAHSMLIEGRLQSPLYPMPSKKNSTRRSTPLLGNRCSCCSSSTPATKRQKPANDTIQLYSWQILTSRKSAWIAKQWPDNLCHPHIAKPSLCGGIIFIVYMRGCTYGSYQMPSNHKKKAWPQRASPFVVAH